MITCLPNAPAVPTLQNFEGLRGMPGVDTIILPAIAVLHISLGLGHYADIRKRWNDPRARVAALAWGLSFIGVVAALLAQFALRGDTALLVGWVSVGAIALVWIAYAIYCVISDLLGPAA